MTTHLPGRLAEVSEGIIEEIQLRVPLEHYTGGRAGALVGRAAAWTAAAAAALRNASERSAWGFMYSRLRLSQSVAPRRRSQQGTLWGGMGAGDGGARSLIMIQLYGRGM